MREASGPANQLRKNWLCTWSLALASCVSLASPGFLAAADPEPISAIVSLEKAVVDSIAKCERSVVAIARGRRGQREELLSRDYIPQEFATGVVVDRRGYILTNYHVLGDPERSDYAVWVAGKAYPVKEVQARKNVTAADPWSDLAILKIEAPELVPIPFGDGSAVKKGQFVLALGNPYAIARDGQPSASWGIIANLSRKAAPNPNPGDNSPAGKETMHHYGTLLHTDARLNQGTSGGALLNLKGEMIGLTTSVAAAPGFEQAAGFAIPVDDTFKRIVDDLKAGREVAYGFLGVRLEGPERAGIRFPADLTGAFVVAVYPGTPAARSGLVAGDIITHLDRRPVQDADSLILNVGRLPVGREVTVRIRRGNQEMDRPLFLSKKPPSSDRPVIASVVDPAWRGMRVDYSTAISNLIQHSINGDLDPRGCVAIVSVDLNSTAWKAGLRPGMFISEVEGKRMTMPEDFFKAVASLPGAIKIRLTQPITNSDLCIVPP